MSLSTAGAKALRQFRTQVELLLREHASSVRLGVAVGVGVFLGCSPFFGLQLLLGLAAGHLLRLNRVAILFGLQVSVPPLTPLVIFVTAQAGALVLRGHWLPLKLSAFQGEPAATVLASLFFDMLVGGALVGGILGFLIGTTSAFGVWWLRGTAALKRLVTAEQWPAFRERLGRLPTPFRSYAYWKLRLDPVYHLVLAELPAEGELVDLGAGIGLLPLLLGLTRPSLRVIGVEWDARKVSAARGMLKGLVSVSVEEADVRQDALGTPSAITLLDILHYSPVSEARRWLRTCAEALPAAGVLLIRELEPRRLAVAPWLERVSVRMKWNRAGGVFPHPSSELARELCELGLTVVRRRDGFGLFRANTLTIARRPEASDGH